MLLLIPATCIGQGTWNTRQDFDEGIRIVGNVTVDNIYVSVGDTIVSIAGHDFLLSDIRLKLYIADTSGMLTPYALLSEVILPADTAAMLTPYSLLSEAILPEDTASMLTPYINHNDTAAMLAPYLVTADIAGKLDVSDTAAMLTPYLHYTEAILPADTASMLTNYSLLSEVILPADTAAMLTNYSLLSEANTAFNSGSGTTIDGSSNIDLGSALDAPTVISGTEVNNLSLNFSDASDRSAKLVFRPADGLSLRAYSGDDYTGDSNYFAVDSNKIVMVQHKGAGMKGIFMDTLTEGIIIRDDIDGVGMLFFDDYSPVYTDRSPTDFEYQITHLGDQLLDVTVYSPGLAQHGGVVVYDSTGRAAGTDHYQIESAVDLPLAAGIQVVSCDTIHFSITTVDTLLTLPEGAVIKDIQVFIETTFDGSGTDLLDIGIIGDGDKYENDMNLGVGSAFFGATNVPDRMSVARYITCQYFDQNSNAANGQAYIYVYYSIH